MAFYLILDEATHSFRRQQDTERSDGQPLLQKIALQGSKWGIYLVVATQMPSLISKVCLSFGTTISFVLNSESECSQMLAH